MRSLKHEEAEELLAIAMDALHRRLRSTTVRDAAPVHPILLEPAGAFVTLKKDGLLRGCMGRLLPNEPLFRVVSDCAVAAALRDPRFDPITADELSMLHIDVSVLGEMRMVQSPDEVEVGKHGLVVRKGGFQGLLLPQVATEMQLDRNRFLELTCRKAGLPSDAWRQDAIIEVFTADVYCSNPDQCHASA
jgi:AmmeMemoRadiSam system protein A